MALMLLLVVAGLMLLPTAALPLGLLMMFGGWWVYERAPGAGRGRGDEGFIAVLMLLGGLGAAALIVRGVWNYLTGAP